MKSIILTMCFAVLMSVCQAQSLSVVATPFERNSATVMEILKGFQAESLDYKRFYAKDCVIKRTSFGSADSTSLEDKMEQDKKNWADMDFKLVTDPINLLPGVNAETKKMDGSVRFYADWKVTKPATDSSRERSGIIKGYSSYDFDKDGKIVFQQFYGDIGGLFMYLSGEEKKE